MIERFEALVGDHREKKRQVRAVGDRNQGELATMQHERTPKPREDLRSDDMLSKIMARLDKLEKGNNFRYEKRNDRPQNQRTCFICKSREHFMKNCPIYKRCQELMSTFNADTGRRQGNAFLSTQ